MVVKIICSCNASFEITNYSRHPEEIKCPNCGQPLPNNASQNLFAALNEFKTFENKLNKTGLYEIVISK